MEHRKKDVLSPDSTRRYCRDTVAGADHGKSFFYGDGLQSHQAKQSRSFRAGSHTQEQHSASSQRLELNTVANVTPETPWMEDRV